MQGLTLRYACVVESKGRTLLDAEAAKVLRSIAEKGSMNAASKALGIPYTKTWEVISRIERVLNGKVIISKKGGSGGGGARLSELGKKLLDLYERGRAMLELHGLSPPLTLSKLTPSLSVAYSSDALFSMVMDKLTEEGYGIRSLCMGSGLSLAMLSLGEVDVACTHLYDPERGIYNEPYLERFWLKDRVELIGGFERQLAFAYGHDLEPRSLDEILEGLLNGKFRLANRNRGSGTRVYLDQLLTSKAKGLGIGLEGVLGYERELSTHEDVAREVAEGSSDVGLVLRYVADRYQLRWFHVTWEVYGCYALRARSREGAVVKLRELLNSDWFRALLITTAGYRALDSKIE